VFMLDMCVCETCLCVIESGCVFKMCMSVLTCLFAFCPIKNTRYRYFMPLCHPFLLKNVINVK
jgi:hypothetical protein